MNQPEDALPAPTDADDAPITFAEIEEAYGRIRNALTVSPCPKSEHLSKRVGSKVYLKMENLQLTGSFKERGACNKLRQLTPEERERGIIASSAGNHAQAIAYHAGQLGISAKIVMPQGTPLVKVMRTKAFGGEVVLCGATYDEAFARAMEIQEQENRVFVHPFNDRAVIAGQGTLGLELLEQNPYLDCVIVPIGGGGLAAGVAIALKETNPKIRVIGVEAAVLPSMQLSLAQGRVVEAPQATTLCDGIAVRRVGEIPLAILETYIDEIVTVTEEEVANAILELLEQEKTMAEGAGAATVAALLGGHVSGIEGKKVCAILSGGNIDVNVIARIIERGLVAAGRIYRIDIQIKDAPGSLAQLLTLIASLNANVLEVYHNRTFITDSPLGLTNVELKLETRGEDHIQELHSMIEARGYKILDGF